LFLSPTYFAMVCPHLRFKGDITYTTVTSCQSSAKICPECDLLLRVVEEHKPGWLNADRVEDKRKRVLQLRDMIFRSNEITLKEGRADDCYEDGWD
jgi:hypothetical protein